MKKTLLSTITGGRYGKIFMQTYREGKALTILDDGEIAIFDLSRLAIEHKGWRLRLRETGSSYGTPNTRICDWQGDTLLFIEDEDLYLGNLRTGEKMLLKSDEIIKGGRKSGKDFAEARLVTGGKVFYVYGWWGATTYNVGIIDPKTKEEKILFSDYGRSNDCNGPLHKEKR